LPAVFLGDYVDRGWNSAKTVDALIAAQSAHPDWVFLKGNHELMNEEILDGTRTIESVDGYVWYSQCEEAQRQFAEAPDTERYLHFFRSLLPYHEMNNVVFTHAPLKDTQQTLEEKTMFELVWNRDYMPQWPGKFFVHGHSPVDAPKVSAHFANVNTSCGMNGYLTGLLIDTVTCQLEKFFFITESGIRLVENDDISRFYVDIRLFLRQ
jgi:serine/threonine protein phosphatase 1